MEDARAIIERLLRRMVEWEQTVEDVPLLGCLRRQDLLDDLTTHLPLTAQPDYTG